MEVEFLFFEGTKYVNNKEISTKIPNSYDMYLDELPITENKPGKIIVKDQNPLGVLSELNKAVHIKMTVVFNTEIQGFGDEQNILIIKDYADKYTLIRIWITQDDQWIKWKFGNNKEIGFRYEDIGFKVDQEYEMELKVNKKELSFHVNDAFSYTQISDYPYPLKPKIKLIIFTGNSQDNGEIIISDLHVETMDKIVIDSEAPKHTKEDSSEGKSDTESMKKENSNKDEHDKSSHQEAPEAPKEDNPTDKSEDTSDTESMKTENSNKNEDDKSSEEAPEAPKEDNPTDKSEDTSNRDTHVNSSGRDNSDNNDHHKSRTKWIIIGGSIGFVVIAGFCICWIWIERKKMFKMKQESPVRRPGDPEHKEDKRIIQMEPAIMNAPLKNKKKIESTIAAEFSESVDDTNKEGEN